MLNCRSAYASHDWQLYSSLNYIKLSYQSTKILTDLKRIATSFPGLFPRKKNGGLSREKPWERG